MLQPIYYKGTLLHTGRNIHSVKDSKIESESLPTLLKLARELLTQPDVTDLKISKEYGFKDVFRNERITYVLRYSEKRKMRHWDSVTKAENEGEPSNDNI